MTGEALAATDRWAGEVLALEGKGAHADDEITSLRMVGFGSMMYGRCGPALFSPHPPLPPFPLLPTCFGIGRRLPVVVAPGAV